MKKILIIGSTGSGKTTLGRVLAARLGYPHSDLDDLFWLPGWTSRTPDDFLAQALSAADRECFVISGNYFSYAGHELRQRADTLVWIDYSFGRNLWQLLQRSLQRIKYKIVICNGNREDWKKLFSKDSIVLWFFRTFYKNRQRYGDIFANPGLYPHLTYIRLTSPAQAEKWLQTLAKAPT
jgi:adenylate kinase family enzyme